MEAVGGKEIRLVRDEDPREWKELGAHEGLPKEVGLERQVTPLCCRKTAGSLDPPANRQNHCFPSISSSCSSLGTERSDARRPLMRPPVGGADCQTGRPTRPTPTYASPQGD